MLTHQGDGPSGKDNCRRRLLKDFVTKQLKTEIFAKLACGRVDSCLFGHRLDELREQVYVLFERAGEEPSKKMSDRPSPLEFRLLDAFLKHSRDPEKGLADFSSGVRVGVGFKLPRVPDEGPSIQTH